MKISEITMAMLLIWTMILVLGGSFLWTVPVCILVVVMYLNFAHADNTLTRAFKILLALLTILTTI